MKKRNRRNDQYVYQKAKYEENKKKEKIKRRNNVKWQKKYHWKKMKAKNNRSYESNMKISRKNETMKMKWKWRNRSEKWNKKCGWRVWRNEEEEKREKHRRESCGISKWNKSANNVNEIWKSKAGISKYIKRAPKYMAANSNGENMAAKRNLMKRSKANKNDEKRNEYIWQRNEESSYEAKRKKAIYERTASEAAKKTNED